VRVECVGVCMVKASLLWRIAAVTVEISEDVDRRMILVLAVLGLLRSWGIKSKEFSMLASRMTRSKIVFGLVEYRCMIA